MGATGHEVRGGEREPYRVWGALAGIVLVQVLLAACGMPAGALLAVLLATSALAASLLVAEGSNLPAPARRPAVLFVLLIAFCAALLAGVLPDSSRQRMHRSMPADGGTHAQER
jgi:hypothetical protein